MLSKTAEYALRAAVWLAQSPDQPSSADQLAEVTKVPRRYLHKVLQDLVRAELVRSQVSGAAGRESTDLARVSPETVVGAQSEKFWSDLVASQRPESADAATWSSSASS